MQQCEMNRRAPYPASKTVISTLTNIKIPYSYTPIIPSISHGSNERLLGAHEARKPY